ncbi:hypothetical protein BR93DRAFT_682005 [Coniochaeta sp. PMI_546]|nr:hypothetical protein BR93DRAFT_682005 [Coniochaeta sp. PMI_546]
MTNRSYNGSSSYRGSSSSGNPAAEDTETEPGIAAFGGSRFAPLSDEEHTQSTPVNGNELADEIVVGTRAKKALLGLANSKTLEGQSKVGVIETTDEEQTMPRVSKRKRMLRYAADDDDESAEEDLRPATSRNVKLRLLTRESNEKAAETQSQDLSATEKPATRQSSFSDVSEAAQMANGAMVPLDAPIRTVIRQPRSKKAQHSINNTASTNSAMEISDSEISESTTPRRTPTVAATTMAAPPQQEPDVQPAGEKTRILLGYWKHSSEDNPEDKHAIMGVLGNNNQLRPRLVKATRDGRTLIGNHPPGAGGVWRNWDEIEFEPHIRHLTRTQLKEYVRLRQRQKEAGEKPEDESANQIAAAERAQAAVEPGDQPSVADFVEPATAIAASQETQATGQKRPRGRLPSVSPRDANRPKRTPTVEQLNARAQEQVAKAEIIQRRNSQRVSNAAAAASTGSTSSLAAFAPTPPPSGPANTNANRRVFDRAVGGMQRNWTAQAEAAARDGVDDAKVYLGTRYEYKRSGDFQGMYAAPGTIISIGDEDYVENRVLRKVGRRSSN